MAATVKASKTGLLTVEQARRKKGWTKTQPAWYDLATTTESTLKRFWRGIAIQQDTFAAICEAVGIEDWQTIADFSPTSDSDTAVDVGFIPSTYNQSTWVERAEVTATLLEKLRSSCRLLVLNGMTGIGKTALVERLVAEIQETEGQPEARSPQKRFCRLNLDDGSISPDFSFSGAALLRSLGDEPTLEDQKDPTNLLNHILQKLRSHPYRVQIDSMERLLEGNDQEGWSDFCDPLWLDLWQQLLAGGDCQSQVIVTTQDVPGKLEAIGSRYPRLWHCEPIRGLTETEQMELFHKTGLVGAHRRAPSVTPSPHSVGAHRDAPSATPSSDDPDPAWADPDPTLGVQQYAPTGGRSIVTDQDIDYLQRIGKLYAGHPLVLRVIAEDIKSTGGNIQRYWQQGGFAEQEAHRPAKFSRRRLQLEVKQRVSDALAQLPEDARQLLCRASVYRRPVPAPFWFALLPERNEAQQQAALNLLQARSFAEEDWEPESWYGADAAIPLRQHNLIRGMAYEMLRADPTIWETAERQAAEMWLTAYDPDPDAPNLEKLRGYLEAFHHYCELEDWDKASEIYTCQIPSTNQQLHWQLLVWGYYKELMSVSSKLADKINSQTKRHCLNQIGNAYRYLGNARKSIEYYQQALKFTRQTGDRQGEGRALICLGLACYNLGDYQQAIDYHQQALIISREIGDRQGEGAVLGNLGNTFNNLGNYQQAIDYHQQHLTIAREIGDRQGEGRVLGNLGIAYHSLGNYQQAIEFHQQYLTIAREIGDRQGEGNALGNLGLAYHSLGNYEQAINLYQQRLTIAREIGDRRGEGNALGNLGNTFNNLGNYQQAIDYHQQDLTIAREIGDRQGEGIAMGNLGSTYCALGNYSEAVKLQNQKLAIAREIGDRNTESYALSGLGEVLLKLEQVTDSLEILQNALEMCEQTGNRSLEAEVLKNLAELHQKIGELDHALEYCDRALQMAIELGIPLIEECEILKRELEEGNNGSHR
ncbi:MAG: hypothetical protein Kow00121_21530 [Elainellaceae cyanobacterium]